MAGGSGKGKTTNTDERLFAALEIRLVNDLSCLVTWNIHRS
jgi:hypothetical protein